MEKKVIATTRTFSCTNLLVFNKDFAYLAHMFPSETVGMNNDFDNRLVELKKLLNHFKANQINVLIALGESVAHNEKQDFHNLDYLNEKINSLKEYCSEINLLATMKSKYLLFDLENFLLYINNSAREIIDANKLIDMDIKKIR